MGNERQGQRGSCKRNGKLVCPNLVEAMYPNLRSSPCRGGCSSFHASGSKGKGKVGHRSLQGTLSRAVMFAMRFGSVYRERVQKQPLERTRCNAFSIFAVLGCQRNGQVDMSISDRCDYDL